ncbi:3-keto-disaccharide hydrolase [Glaciecola petra]|uniref:DUF1080 domain-containing protein n=1 Tax=Glaciecola petra TaxID=3075602 RepID=A0ABU2ZV17_9ALTE|nr:DUF1080 domain-containing protein [Aestuariibacter sp. P117]MDT0596492.1 DUF1080 domain-containing protein [Aestuariibacter sp. P117]
MHKFKSILTYCIALTTLMGAFLVNAKHHDNQLTEQEKSIGWELLFNGKDMSQWRNFKSDTLSPKWQVIDGTMVLTQKGGGDILSLKQYQHFELSLEWKIAEVGNSGIFILADENGEHIYSHAPEVQILDNERHPDNKVDSRLSGSMYDMLASPVSSHKPAGKWNQIKIKLKDMHLQVWQNEVNTLSIVIGSSGWNKLVANSKFATWQGFAKNKSGHIGLQDHGDVVAFKNIKIRAL